ncbi:MAG: TonB-dependent receptor plug domain-containing protein [Gammaproteobacteria bacterium]
MNKSYQAMLVAVALGVFPTATFADPSAPEEANPQDAEQQEQVVEELLVKARASSANTWDVEELEGIAGTSGDILLAIDILPGITFPVGDDGPDDGFYVRGSDQSDNAVRLDRQNLPYLFHLGGPATISLVNPGLVEQFSVDINGVDVSNPEQLGGVISAQLRAPRTDRLHQSYKFGFLEAGFALEGPISETSSFWVAGRRSYFDLILPALGLDSFEDEEVRIIQFPNYYDLQARWHIQLPDGFMDLTWFSARDQVGIEFRNLSSIDPSLYGRLSADTGFQTLQYRWHQNLASDWLQRLEVSVLRDQTFFQIGTQQADDLNPGEPFGLDSSDLISELRLAWTHAGSPKVNWQFGVDLQVTQVDLSGYLSSPPDSESGVVEQDFSQRDKFVLQDQVHFSSLQPYLAARLNLSALWDLYVGVRMGHYETTGTGGFADASISPRLEFGAQVSPQVRLSASWAALAQLPSELELSSSLGNPDILKLQQAAQSTLALGWQISNYSRFRAELWDKQLDDLVVKTDGVCEQCYANAGTGSAQGLDIIWQLGYQGVSSLFSYGYLQSDRLNGLNADRFLASGDQPHSLVFAHRRLFAKDSLWAWSLRVNLSSGQPHTPVIGRMSESVDQVLPNGETNTRLVYYPIYGELNSERLPALVDIDLAFERKAVYEHSQAVFRLDLLNVSSLLYATVRGYDYGEDYADFANPQPIDEALFIPSFSFEWQY